MSNCDWAGVNPNSRLYHDDEWGVPVHDDIHMFEHLSLECLQCGLSWNLMLAKRQIFRRCFDGFDFDRIARYDESDVARILNTEGMLRSPGKVSAIIRNARGCQAIRAEFGSFCDYFWSFSGGKTLLYDGHDIGPIPVSNGLSARIARDLRKRGFSYVGPVTLYSHLQACGIINDHNRNCPCRERINRAHPTTCLPRDAEEY